MIARLVVMAGVLGAGAASAAAAPRLSWRGPAGCGSDQALADRVAAAVALPLAEIDGVVAEVVVERAPLARELVARISVVTASARSRREVRGVDCAAVLDAAALVVATAIDGLDADEPPPSIVAAAPTPPPAPAGRFDPQDRARVHLRVDGWSDAGTMPELRLGAGGAIGLSYARFRAELGAAWWRRDWVAGGGEAPVALREVDVRGCGAAWRVWLCGGAHVGRFTEVSTAGQRWSALSASVRWTRPVGAHAAVSAAIDGLAAIDRLSGADGMPVHRTAPLAVRIGLAVEAIVF